MISLKELTLKIDKAILNFASSAQLAKILFEELNELELFPIETFPEEYKNTDTYILLAGPSGYSTTPLRMEVCRYDSIFRPRQPWVTYSNDSFLDSGEPPTHWCNLPKVKG